MGHVTALEEPAQHALDDRTQRAVLLGEALRVHPDMHARKHMMLTSADAVVGLPGGCGTLEELLEAITWKRLGLYAGPIAILNLGGFYDPLLSMLDRCIRERFMDERHAAMWTSVSEPEEVMPALLAAPPWEPRRAAVCRALTPDLPSWLVVPLAIEFCPRC